MICSIFRTYYSVCVNVLIGTECLPTSTDHHSTRHSSSSPPSVTHSPSLVELSLPRPYPLVIPPPAQCLDQYARYLKGLYGSRLFPTYFKYPIIRQRAKHFINLALVDSSADPEEQQTSVLLQINGQVDEIRKKKKSLRIDEVGRLKDGNRAYYILIEGAPGIGKNHLCMGIMSSVGKRTAFATVVCPHTDADERQACQASHDPQGSPLSPRTLCERIGFQAIV